MKCLKKFYKENASKFKDIGLVAFAICLIGIGYINFANNDNTVETVSKSTNSLGDVELVNSNVVEDAALVENSNTNTIIESEYDYFSEAKLNRNIMFDEALEVYQKILENETISNEQKVIAIQETDKITKQKNSIAVAEELILLRFRKCCNFSKWR